MYSQYSIDKFHYRNQFSIGAFYGVGIDSRQYELQFQKIKNNEVGFNVFTHFENESNKMDELDFEYYDIGISGFYNLLKGTRSKNYFIHANAGAYGGYEQLSSKIADDNTSKFIYGLKVGLDNEFYFAKKFIFSLQFNQYYSINSELGKFHWIALGGLKYIIK
jgi:hypothetical protein